MNIKRITCCNCFGTGKTDVYKVVFFNDDTGIGTMQKEEAVCTSCNGQGYTEHAVFSVEEAKAILKHCGLSTEG